MDAPVAPLERLDRDELSATIRACTLCPLHATRTQAIPTHGPDQPAAMLLLDAPGYLEDRAGEPLIGPPGELVARMLQRAGLTVGDIAVSFVARCHPPGSRGLTQDEVRACEGYLFREMALLGPRVVVACGATPARLVSGSAARLSSMLGTPVPVRVAGHGAVLLPLHDPRAAWQAPDLAANFEASGDTLKALLAGNIDEAPAAPSPARPQPPARPVGPAVPRGGDSSAAAASTEQPAGGGEQLGFDLGAG